MASRRSNIRSHSSTAYASDNLGQLAAISAKVATQATLADLDTRIGDSIHPGNQTFGETQNGRIMVTAMGRDAANATMRALACDASGHLSIDVAGDGLATQATLASVDTRIADSIHAGSQVFGEAQNGRICVNALGRDASGAQMRALAVDGSGHLQCDVLSTTAASGSATEAKQDDGITQLTSIDTRIANSINTGATTFGETQNGRICVNALGRDASGAQMRALAVDGSGHLQCDVLSTTAASGSATEAKQDDGITQLTSIDTRIANSINTGATTYGDASNGRICVNVLGRDVGNTTMRALAVDADGHSQCDVLSSALPSGASTGAKQDTGNTSLGSIDGKITACNTGAVVISGSLPAGSAAIGKLAANSGVDIGDVDVTSCALPSGASTSTLQSTGNTSLAAIVTDCAALEVLSTAGNASLVDIETNTNYGAVTGGGAESGALRVTMANDSTGVMTIDHSVPLTTATTANTAVANGNTLAHSIDFGTSAATTNLTPTFLVDSDDPNPDSFQVQVSSDSSTWYNLGDPATTLTANTHISPDLQSGARYMRLLYTNGSGAGANVGVVSSYWG